MIWFFLGFVAPYVIAGVVHGVRTRSWINGVRRIRNMAEATWNSALWGVALNGGIPHPHRGESDGT